MARRPPSALGDEREQLTRRQLAIGFVLEHERQRWLELRRTGDGVEVDHNRRPLGRQPPGQSHPPHVRREHHADRHEGHGNEDQLPDAWTSQGALCDLAIALSGACVRYRHSGDAPTRSPVWPGGCAPEAGGVAVAG